MTNPKIDLKPEYFHEGDLRFKQRIISGSEVIISCIANSSIEGITYEIDLFRVDSIGQFFNMNGVLVGTMKIVDFKINTWEFETIPVTILGRESEGEITFKFTATNSDIYEIERDVIKWMVRERIIDLFKDIIELTIFAEKHHDH